MQARVSNDPKHEPPYTESEGRRAYKEWFKAQVVEECRAPGASVSLVARRHDINSNVLFRWRREYRLGIIRPSQRPNGSIDFVPVGVIDADGRLIEQAPEKPATSAPAPAKANPSAVKALTAPIPAVAAAKIRPGVVELHLSGHVKMIRIQGDVGKEALQTIFDVARELV
jgi:transposase